MKMLIQQAKQQTDLTIFHTISVIEEKTEKTLSVKKKEASQKRQSNDS
ncbi:hypothetical protein [Arsenophonus endosymbiont of Bemisia tabaci]|nr:hypothetical protein [Arsenophonus endosymbiont of Bemisia tabaci]